MTPDIYRWKVFHSVSVLGLISQPRVVITTLCYNESIAKLVVCLDDNHPFDIQQCINISYSLDEPWKTAMYKGLAPLLGKEHGFFDMAATWT